MVRLPAALACAALLQAQHSPVEEAWALVGNGRRPEAIQLLSKVVLANPQNADARLLLGSLYQEAGQRTECLEQLNAAVKLRPGSAEAQNALGEAYNAFGEPQRARQPFERAVALNARALLGQTPEAAYPLYLRAKIYTGRNELQRPAAALGQAVKLRPDFGEAWSDLGVARKSLGDEAGAMDAFRRSTEISPDDAVAQTRLALEYLAQGEAHLAIPHFQAAVQSVPGDQSALNGLQRALRQDGQVQQADEVKQRLTDLLRAKDQADQNSLAALRLNNEGAGLEKAGNLRAAAEKYGNAHRLDPNHVGIQVNYAVALLRLGEWKEGLELLRDAVRRQPQDAKLKTALEDALRQAPVEFGGQGQARTTAKTAGKGGKN